MAFSPNSAQSRELNELRNHLKWLDEERRKTARKLGEMEQRIAQQGRELTDRDKRIHELEWQLAQMAERVEQMPEMGAGTSAQEQRLQDLEWHMSNINAQLVRLPKLDEELTRFRTELSQYTVDLENRLISQQSEAAQRFENDVYVQLREEIAQAADAYDDRPLVAAVAQLEQELAVRQTEDQRLALMFAEFQAEDERLARLFAEVQAEDERLLSLYSELRAEIAQTAAIAAGAVAATESFSMDATIAKLQEELAQRQAEEVRLADLMVIQEGKLERARDQIDEMNRVVATMQSRMTETSEDTAALHEWLKELDENWKPTLVEAGDKLVPLSEQLATLGIALSTAEASLQTIKSEQVEIRNQVAGTSDEMRLVRQELGQQVETWQVTLDENKETIDRFSQQWQTLSNQYKEARMAVQNFAHWQKQLEQQKREASEMLRVESNRMQSRWEGFLLEIQDQLKNYDLDLAQKWQAFELENEQRWVAARRNEEMWREELASIDELIVKLQQDSRNLIWRVQAAQADAIKKWPRLLLEEVEKAVELNPNRRLPAAPVAAARSDMSVADAIEQGLIKVDYEDDPADDTEA